MEKTKIDVIFLLVPLYKYVHTVVHQLVLYSICIVVLPFSNLDPMFSLMDKVYLTFFVLFLS